ncbi:MAG TPA: hypothetical protein VGD91_11415 [Trebonia sp.]
MRLIGKLTYSLAAAVPVIALAACSGGSGGTPSAPPPEVQSITIDVVPTADAAGIYIAQDNGYFARQGPTDTSQMQTGNQALYVLPSSPYKTVQALVKAHAEAGVNTRYRRSSPRCRPC